jgi:TPR repeat protein
VAKNEAEAVKLYRKAGEQGHAMAQYNLGLCYGEGTGVEKNVAQSFNWYRKAADQGQAPAQFNLGCCYYNGQGVVKNDLLAYQWCLLASANGHEMARKNVPAIEAKLTAEQRAEGQRLASAWQAKFEESLPAG